MEKPYFKKRENAWYCNVTGEDGKRRRRRLSADKKEAHRIWLSWQGGIDPDSSAPVGQELLGIFGEYFEAIKKDAENGQISRGGLQGKMGRLKPFVQWIYRHYPHISCSAFSLETFEEFAETRTNWNQTTRHDCFGDIKRVFNWARERRKIEANPIDRIPMAKGKPREFYCSRELYEKTIHAAGGSKFGNKRSRAFRPVLIALYLTGARPGEVRAVKVENCNGTRWVLRDHKTAKKTGKPRVIYLSPCMQTLVKICKHGRKTGNIFQRFEGEPWREEDFMKRFRRIKAKIDAPPKYTMYGLRHTYITNALLAGQDIATVATLTGTSVKMIAEVYQHLAMHDDHLMNSIVAISAFGQKETPEG